MHSRVAQTWAKLPNAVIRLDMFVWLEEITNRARYSDQINRARPVDDLSFSGTRCAHTDHPLAVSTLSSFGKLVFPREWQPGVKEQAGGGQCGWMASSRLRAGRSIVPPEMPPSS